MPSDSTLAGAPREQTTGSSTSEVADSILETNKRSHVTIDDGVIYNDQARLLLLANVLTNDRVLTHNGKAFFKELIIRKDPRLMDVVLHFSSIKGMYTQNEDDI